MITITVITMAACFIIMVISYLSKTNWWERHVCKRFSKTGHNEICFDCNLIENQSCYSSECPIINSKKVKMII